VLLEHIESASRRSLLLCTIWLTANGGDLGARVRRPVGSEIGGKLREPTRRARAGAAQFSAGKEPISPLAHLRENQLWLDTMNIGEPATMADRGIEPKAGFRAMRQRTYRLLSSAEMRGPSPCSTSGSRSLPPISLPTGAAHRGAKVAPFRGQPDCAQEQRASGCDFECSRSTACRSSSPVCAPPNEYVPRIHRWGGLVFHDITNIRHAEKALEAGWSMG